MWKNHGRLCVTNIFDDVLTSFFIFGVLLHIFDNLSGCVNHGGMISAAEFISDGCHRHLRDFSNDIHGNLSGIGNLRGTLGGTDVFGTDSKGASDL